MAFRELSGTPFSIFHILKQKSQFPLRKQETVHPGFCQQQDEMSIAADLSSDEVFNFKTDGEKPSTTASSRCDGLEIKDGKVREEISAKDFKKVFDDRQQSLETTNRDGRKERPALDSSDKTDTSFGEPKISSKEHVDVEERISPADKDSDAKNSEVILRTKSRDTDEDEHSSGDNERFAKYANCQHAVFRQHNPFHHHHNHLLHHHPGLGRFVKSEELSDDLKLHPYRFDFKPNLKLSESDSEPQDGGEQTV